MRRATMTVHDLAVALRTRCEAYLASNRNKSSAEQTETIKRQNQIMTDEEINDSYVTCSS
jgi:hypothetical protein